MARLTIDRPLVRPGDQSGDERAEWQKATDEGEMHKELQAGGD